MGAYFLVVNPVRRQYLDPARFGEGIKFRSVLRGDYCLEALKLMISDCFVRDATSFRGAWLSDPIILAGDDSGIPDPGGLETANSDHPTRNLHTLATEEFTNISYRALAELCLDAEIAAELADRAKDEPGLLIDLGATLEQYPSLSLEFALTAAVGKPWRKAYNQSRIQNPWRQTLAQIDWPL